MSPLFSVPLVGSMPPPRCSGASRASARAQGLSLAVRRILCARGCGTDIIPPGFPSCRLDPVRLQRRARERVSRGTSAWTKLGSRSGPRLRGWFLFRSSPWLPGSGLIPYCSRLASATELRQKNSVGRSLRTGPRPRPDGRQEPISRLKSEFGGGGPVGGEKNRPVKPLKQSFSGCYNFLLG